VNTTNRVNQYPTYLQVDSAIRHTLIFGKCTYLYGDKIGWCKSGYDDSNPACISTLSLL